MMQKSVLSAVAEDRQRVMQNLSASDRARMDQYFTSVRQTELQMEAELQRPNIEAKVSIPEAPSGDLVANNAWPNLQVATPLMARLGAIALATDQTRVFNLSVSAPQNQMFVPGDPLGFHQSTHEEPVDPKLGYQPRVAQYNIESMQLFAALLKELDAIQEGDGTLLDHSLVMAFTDQSYARIHSVDGLPILVAGGASGRMKTGYHIAGDNSPVSRVGLTLQKALGVSVDSWGKDSLQSGRRTRNCWRSRDMKLRIVFGIVAVFRSRRSAPVEHPPMVPPAGPGVFTVKPSGARHFQTRGGGAHVHQPRRDREVPGLSRCPAHY